MARLRAGEIDVAASSVYCLTRRSYLDGNEAYIVPRRASARENPRVRMSVFLQCIITAVYNPLNESHLREGVQARGKRLHRT